MAEQERQHDESANLAAPTQATEGRPNYEFSDLENQRFTRLAGAMQFVAVLEIACGLAFAFVALPQVMDGIRAVSVSKVLTPLGAVLVPPIIGVWTYRAAGRLRRIVSTEGDDIRHLMAAVGELTNLYILQMGLWLLATGGVVWLILATDAISKWL